MAEGAVLDFVVDAAQGVADGFEREHLGEEVFGAAAMANDAGGVFGFGIGVGAGGRDTLEPSVPSPVGGRWAAGRQPGKRTERSA